MKLDAIAKFAEIVASVAVVASLMALVFEMRENTNTLRRTTYESLSTQVGAWRMVQATDPELHRIYYKEVSAGEPWQLEGAEKERFVEYMTVLWQIYEQAFYANMYGDLERLQWERFRVWTCDRPVPKEAWNEIRTVMSEPFVEFVESCRTKWM
jgi:hypothetical protein